MPVNGNAASATSMTDASAERHSSHPESAEGSKAKDPGESLQAVISDEEQRRRCKESQCGPIRERGKRAAVGQAERREYRASPRESLQQADKRRNNTPITTLLANHGTRLPLSNT